MADQRLELRCKNDIITIAVRHGNEWRAAADASNDIGEFLNRIGSEAEISFCFESDREWPDPIIKTSPCAVGPCG